MDIDIIEKLITRFLLLSSAALTLFAFFTTTDMMLDILEQRPPNK